MWRKIALAAFALITLSVLADQLHLVTTSGFGDSVKGASEAVLQQNLFTLRALLNQYKLDLQKRPQSLDDLVVAGYLKRVPSDPMTKRNDTWVVEWSNDPRMQGIVNIRSRSRAISSKGTMYSDW